MMSLARPFKVQNGTYFSLNHSKDVNYPTKGAMVRPCILAGVEGFTLCKDDLHPFHNYHAIFEVAVKFSTVLFLIQVV
jgi:hypothetical protein